MKKYFQGMKFSRMEGVTLIELITVVILIGITLTVAIPKFTGLGSTELKTVAMQVQSDIRYTQELAMSKYSKSSVVFESGDKTYKITYSGSSKNKSLPDRSRAEFVKEKEEDFSLIFKFNSLGEPIEGAGKMLRISIGDEEHIDIKVEDITGRAIIIPKT